MSEPRALVEHFFRYEFGRLVAVLTRSQGMSWLAVLRALETFGASPAVVAAVDSWYDVLYTEFTAG